MVDREQMRWKKLEEYVKETTEYLEENMSEVIDDIIEIQLMVRFIYDLLVINVLFCYSKIVLVCVLR